MTFFVDTMFKMRLLFASATFDIVDKKDLNCQNKPLLTRLLDIMSRLHHMKLKWMTQRSKHSNFTVRRLRMTQQPLRPGSRSYHFHIF